MLSTESRCVIGPSNILYTGMYVCTFQPRNFTGGGSEGVKMGSDESHFIVPLIVNNEVTRCCSQLDHMTFERRGKPKLNRTEVLLLTSLTPYR